MIKLSVIIPTRNRAKVLQKALYSIVSQTLANDEYEVIVVDNGSVDNTKDIVNTFNDKIKNLIYIYDENPGLHIGRHRGLLAAQSDILVYGDDDIEALPTWLEGILESFEDPTVALVGGKNIPNFESMPPDWILEIWEKGNDKKVLGHLSILDFGEEIHDISPFYIFGCNFSIRKNILIDAGGFHPDGMPQELIRYRGDGETYVSQYIQDKGYKAIYNPKASVYHLVSTGRMKKSYFQQRAYNQGISDSYTAIRNGKQRYFWKMYIKLWIKKYLLAKDIKIDKSYIDGYKYHQQQVRESRQLEAWVKRESYIYHGEIE